MKKEKKDRGAIQKSITTERKKLQRNYDNEAVSFLLQARRELARLADKERRLTTPKNLFFSLSLAEEILLFLHFPSGEQKRQFREDKCINDHPKPF